MVSPCATSAAVRIWRVRCSTCSCRERYVSLNWSAMRLKEAASRPTSSSLCTAARSSRFPWAKRLVISTSERMGLTTRFVPQLITSAMAAMAALKTIKVKGIRLLRCPKMDSAGTSTTTPLFSACNQTACAMTGSPISLMYFTVDGNKSAPGSIIGAKAPVSVSLCPAAERNFCMPPVYGSRPT